MKHSIFTLLFILSLAQAFGQQNSDFKTYGGSLFDEGHGITQTRDGGFFIVGATASFGDTLTDFYFLKLDARGEVEYTKIFGGDQEEGGNYVVETTDGGYFITCHRESNSSGYCDSYVVKLDVLGNIQWSRFYGGAADDVGHIGIQTKGGDYLVAGFRGINYSFGHAKSFVVKYDPDGKTVWAKTYGDTALFNTFYGIAEVPEGGYLLSGYTNITHGDYSRKINLLRIDEEGNVIWEKQPFCERSQMTLDIKPLADGNYILAGAAVNAAGQQCPYLSKINSSGDMIWEQYYDGSAEKNPEIRSVIVAADGGFVMTGVTYSNDTAGDVLLLKANPEGEMLWQKIIGEDGYDKGLGILETKEGKYTILANTMRNGNMDILLISSDGDGNVIQFTESLPYSEPSVSIFPNPMQETAIVRFANMQNRALTASIYDLAGRQLSTLNTSSTGFVLTREKLPAGTYFISISDKNELIATRKVVVN